MAARRSDLPAQPPQMRFLLQPVSTCDDSAIARELTNRPYQPPWRLPSQQVHRARPARCANRGALNSVYTWGQRSILARAVIPIHQNGQCAVRTEYDRASLFGYRPNRTSGWEDRAAATKRGLAIPASPHAIDWIAIASTDRLPA